MDELLNEAIEQSQKLNSNEEFLVKELFRGYKWNRIEKRKRLRLGILFLNEVSNKPDLGITVLDKTSANQQKYRKN